MFGFQTAAGGALVCKCTFTLRKKQDQASDIYEDKASRPQVIFMPGLDSELCLHYTPSWGGEGWELHWSQFLFLPYSVFYFLSQSESKNHLWKGCSSKSLSSYPEVAPTAMKPGLSTERGRCQAEEEGLEECRMPWFLQQEARGWRERTALPPTESQGNV